MAVKKRKQGSGRKSQSAAQGVWGTIRNSVRENPKPALIGGGCVAGLVVILIVLRGCGGCGGAMGGLPNPPAVPTNESDGGLPEARPTPKPPAATKPTKPAGAAPANTENSANAGKSGSGSKTRALPPPAPPRAELDQWDEYDFSIARATGDSRLVPAVEQWSKSLQHTEDEVDLLAWLMKPRPTSGEPSTGKPVAAVPQAPLLRAVIAALGENGTPAARKVLAQVITGRLKTEDDKTAVDATLRTLAAHSCPENEEMLLRVATTAKQLRPPGTGAVGAESLQQQAIGMIAQGASSQTRLRMAQFLLDPSAAHDLAEMFGGVIKQPHRANLEAQILWYKDARLEPATREALEKSFVSYSCDAVGQALGLAANVPTAPDPQWPVRVARTLWSADFGALLQQRLHTVASLKDERQAVLLASTIPTASMRAALYQVLAKNWGDGPDTLKGAEFLGGTTNEPGFVAVLKMAARRGKADAKERFAKRVSGASAKAAAAMKARRQHDDDLDLAWAKAREELLTNYCRFLEKNGGTAGTGAGRAGDHPDTSGASGKLGVALLADAQTVAACCLQLPAERGQALADMPPKPIAVRYLRLQAQARPTKAAAYYRRQLKQCEDHKIANGVWLDGLQAEAGAGHWRSVDVLLTSSKPDTERMPDEDQEMTVTILSIELDKPIGADSGSPSALSEK